MPITSIDDTTISMVCYSGDAITWSVAVADAKVGTYDSPNLIHLSGCSNPNHAEWVRRTWDNPTKLAGAVNGLHRALVTAAQWGDARWTAQLGAEIEADKPSHYYTLSGTPIDKFLGVDEKWATDVLAAYSLFGIGKCQELLALDLIYTDSSEADIATFLTNLYPSSEATRTYYSNLLLTRKGLYFP